MLSENFVSDHPFVWLFQSVCNVFELFWRTFDVVMGCAQLVCPPHDHTPCCAGFQNSMLRIAVNNIEIILVWAGRKESSSQTCRYSGFKNIAERGFLSSGKCTQIRGQL